MEGRGSGVEDWRGEAHLGSSLPVSAPHRPCPLVVSRVHASWPVSARCCLCLRIVSRVCVSFPMSARRSPCPCVVPHVRASFPVSARRCPWSAHHSPHPFTFVGSRFHSWAWVVAFVRGWSSSFGGVHLRSWAVRLRSWAMAGCGGGEPLVGGGESSGLASLAVVVASWCQVVCVTVVALSSGCHVTSCDVAPWVGVNEEAGRGVVLLTWAGHDLAAVIVVVALWRALDGGGGWVALSMVVVVGRKKQRCGNI